MSDTYVPIDELAKYLSVKVSTVRTWVQKGYIVKTGYIKVGSTYRFNIPSVVAGLKQEPVPQEEVPTHINDIVQSFEEELFDSEDEGITEQLELDFNEDEDI